MLVTLLDRWAQECPTLPALTTESRSWNWREYREAVVSIAAQLSSLNISRLALAHNNGPEWAIIDLACLYSGVICIPVPPLFFTGTAGMAT
ncbi:AMP-binding protein [Erwinia sp. AnSW2-5]|uniref:AMP-binding protein n=1 Tax=Erwinia sp. AnSW2-5 TaxID=3367692 RepID=UPI00385A6251